MSDDEELDELDLSGVATYLSDLSQEGQLPAGVGPPVDVAPFTADEVDFKTNDWLVKTMAVQAWLCLDAPVKLGVSPSDAATYLMEQVSPDPPSSCVAVEGDLVRLTPLGGQHLETWLSRAVAHREAFLEALAEDQSPKEASEEWNLLWEESESLARQAAAIKAEVTTYLIKNLSDLAREDKLDLNPSYQRDTVWSVGDSQLLIDSILRGIPLPSIILNKDEGERLQIVDGKQRLTAILRFIGRHPLARKFAESKGSGEEFDKNFRKCLRRWRLSSTEVMNHCLPFRLASYPDGHPLHELSGKYYTEIAQTKIPFAGATSTLATIFDSVTSKYKIPVITYEQTRLQDIHDIFSIYNKQGKKLNAEELRNATYHHLGLTRLLLVLSGDRPDFDTLAPYLPPEVRQDLAEVGNTLRDLGFGTQRFKRTKVLSWVCGILLHSPRRLPSNHFSTPSTSSHINSMLIEISREQGSHHMFHSNNLVALARDLKAAVVAHSDARNAWHPKFRSKKGHASRWEELPLVASLLATTILVACGQIDALKTDAAIASVRALTEVRTGPTKTQNKTQWDYIAKMVVAILSTVGVPVDSTVPLLEKRYGYGCTTTLKQMAGPES